LCHNQYMTFAFWRQIQKVSSQKPRIHLDYASATPVHPDVYSAMQPYFSDEWANPSAIYREGVQARAVIESARIELARTLRVKPSEITFTSGGTEANNLALIGVIEAERNAGREYIDMEIISTRIEHPSILETLAYLERKGVTIRYGSVDAEGCVNPEQVATLLSTKTILCTFGYVNAEIGVVQDIKKLTRMVRAWNETHHASVYVHTDASQAPLWLPCALDALGVDLMTLDAGKCYGPKGAGVLIHRATVSLQAVTHGGGQESRLRSGTENTALIVGCVRALVRAQASQVSRSQATAVLRDTFFDLLIKAIPGVMINGSRTARVANNVNISIPGIDTEYAVITLDAKGIAVSTRSACSAVGSAGSYVVREMTHDAGRAEKTLRCTLGESTSKEDIEYTVQVLRAHVAHMRSTTSLV
jgi:cysteine desulfurase